MNGLRKGLVFVLCPLLFVALVGLAVSTSSNINLKNPQKLENWLASSKLYDNFIGNASNLAEKSTGDDQSGSVSLSDTAVVKAAQSAFTADFLKQNVNTFIESNYAWLQGKTDKPEFKIDLTEAKNSFAVKVGQYVTAYSANLPVCTPAQQAQVQTADPLTAVCRPAATTPEQLGAQVTTDIKNGDFLSNSVITPDNINPDKTSANQPYYRKLSYLPKLYSLGTNLPYITGAISVLSILGLVLLSATKRGGFKKSGWTLAVAGIVLVGAKFSSDLAFNQLEQRAFNNASIGQLQQSLTTFGRSIESAFTQTEMYFGIAYLVLALIILLVLKFTGNKPAKETQPSVEPAKVTPSNVTTPTPTAPSVSPTPPARPPKKPRLIQ